MTNNRANMQNHQDGQNNAGNIMEFFKNSDEASTINRCGYQEQVE